MKCNHRPGILFASAVVVVSTFTVASGICADEATKHTSSFRQQWLKSVVSVEQADNATNARPIGTGFLLLTPKKHVVVVTAKHLIVDERGKPIPNLALLQVNELSQ